MVWSMLKDLTEIRIYYDRKETVFDKYIDSLLAGNIENLTIKEGYIMLERLKNQRGVYAAELEKLKSTDLEAVKNARFELIKEKIAEEVEMEFNEKLTNIKTKIEHYDFVIDELEMKAVEEIVVENVEE